MVCFAVSTGERSTSSSCRSDSARAHLKGDEVRLVVPHSASLLPVYSVVEVRRNIGVHPPDPSPLINVKRKKITFERKMINKMAV